MTDAEPSESHVPIAAELARGICRLFLDLGYSALTEFTLASGRRADVAALSRTGEIVIVEIKTSIADFRADGKWPEYLEYCDAYYFAVPEAFPREVLPDHTGLIVADRFGAAIVRQAPLDRVVAARRKAVTLRFARTAASRLNGLIDPPL